MTVHVYLHSQAMDGFLLVTDKDANILYVSENITDYVGLSQVMCACLHVVEGVGRNER